jgi:hypothetical protein
MRTVRPVAAIGTGLSGIKIPGHAFAIRIE